MELSPDELFYGAWLVAFVVIVIVVTYKVDRKTRGLIRPLLSRAHERLGQAPADPGGDLFVSRITLDGLGECAVETKTLGDPRELASLELRVPRHALQVPDELGFEAIARSNDRRADAIRPGEIPHVRASITATLTWDGVRIRGSLGQLLDPTMPDVLDLLGEIDPERAAPVTILTLDDDILRIFRSLTNDVLTDDFDARFDGFLEESARVARAFAWDVDHPEDPLEALLWSTELGLEPDSRRVLCALLLDAFPGTPAAERTWRHALDHGDLDDMLLAVHHDRARAVAELSTHRLIILANALAEATDAFTTRALPEHITARFAPDALLDARLSWPVRRALLEHWLAARGPGDPELLECVRQMHGRLDPKPRQELEALLAAHPEVALQGRLSLSHDGETRGALSEPAGEAGDLSQTDD